MVHDRDTALDLLRTLGAPPRLVRHHELVAEAAQAIVDGLGDFAACFDANAVVAGAAVHDAGKILHPSELAHPGSQHEGAGRALLEEHGFGDLARFCVTHGRWDADDLALEDLLVALADKLWKGRRVAELERRVVEGLAAEAGVGFWDVFAVADGVFEDVASHADERLRRSIA